MTKASTRRRCCPSRKGFSRVHNQLVNLAPARTIQPANEQRHIAHQFRREIVYAGQRARAAGRERTLRCASSARTDPFHECAGTRMRSHNLRVGKMRTFGLRFAFGGSALRTADNGPASASISLRHPGSRVFSPRARAARASVTHWSCPELFRGSGGHAFQSVADPMCAGRAIAGFVRPETVRARFERRSMRQKILTALAFWGCAFGLASGQDPTPAPATAAEIQELRQQVQALTEMVKTLQQQVQDQQAASAAGTSPLPQNPEPPELAGAASPSAPSASAPPLFPTTDSSVVASSSAGGSAAPGAR